MAGDGSRDLVERAREGDPAALQELFGRCAERLLPLVRLRLGPALRARLESRDVLQDCLMRAYQRMDQFQGQETAAFVGWMVRMVENQIRDQVDHHRRQRRDARRDVALSGAPQPADPTRSVVSRVALTEEALRLERALESLEPDHREVILLRRFEELEFAEIGRRMHRSPDASRMLFARAMAALTLSMGEAG